MPTPTRPSPTTPTTLDLARTMAQVADGLTEYTHLPSVDFVAVAAWGKSSLHFIHAHSREELPHLCAWAAAFNTDITIELSYGGSGTARAEVTLGGHPAKLEVSLHSGKAYELGAALRRPISTQHPTLTVTPADLLAALGGGGEDG